MPPPLTLPRPNQEEGHLFPGAAPAPWQECSAMGNTPATGSRDRCAQSIEGAKGVTDGDDEIAVTGSKGMTALVDLPHSRRPTLRPH